jgi:hypothetical protein
MEDDRDFSQFDPAKLLPFTRILEQSNPEAKKPPPEFNAWTDDLYVGSEDF